MRKAGPTPGWLCRPIVTRLEGRDSPRRRERGREVSERLVEVLALKKTAGIFKTENGAEVSAGGARQSQNNYTIDGVGVTSVS